MSGEYDEITRWAEPERVKGIIRHYDADFDIPLRHGHALGVFRVADAFASPERAVKVGAYWCDVVRADVEYDLLDGLRLTDLSRADAERLRDECQRGRVDRDDDFTWYVTARWFNGTGKILYRLGSYSRARINFETAFSLARKGGLWWCLPDLRSDFLRADFEERSQTAGSRLTKEAVPGLIRDLQQALGEAKQEARRRGIDFEGPKPPDARAREFLRGCSNLLHNLAITRRQTQDFSTSLRTSRQSFRISEVLEDGYRIGQSRTLQAQLQPEQALELFTKLSKGRWKRGRRIARQHLARLKGGPEGIRDLDALLAELDGDGGLNAGMDIGFYDYAVNKIYADMVAGVAGRVPEEDYAGFREDLARRRLTMARSVRRAVALPAYKRAYSVAIRPNYLERIAVLIAKPTTGREAESRHVLEEAFGLAEETSARELLDLLSASSLPLLSVPDKPARIVWTPGSGTRSPEGRRRRGELSQTDAQDETAVREVLKDRETEFETQFLRQPLDTAPHDPEIAHRVRMYTVNHPGTCVVRYFVHGGADDTRLSAFVFRDGRLLDRAKDIPYSEVRELAHDFPSRRAPSKEESTRLWELFIEPIWKHVTTGGIPEHLVIIPVDDMFSLPLHVASSKDGPPLAALVPMSQSVSATAFISRGRHLLRRQPVEPTDDLAAIVIADRNNTDMRIGEELIGTRWEPRQVLVAGDVPSGLEGVRSCEADWEGLGALSAIRPEFFVYAGHGQYHSKHEELGPYLQLREDILTQYDVALRLRLPRNKLSVIGACLAGQGTQSGGDVAGFLRTFVAAGAGAIGLPLWSVDDDAMVDTTRALLSGSRDALSAPDQAFDIVTALHRQYQEAVHPDSFTMTVENMPLSLYL